MTPLFRIRPLEALIIATVAGLTAIWCFSMLMVIATPSEVAEGAPRAIRELDREAAALATPGNPNAYPANALCHAPPDTAADTVRRQLTAAAMGGGITLSDVTLVAGAPDSARGWLAPVSVRLAASGPYDGMMNFLRVIAKSNPAIFLDTADLRSQTSAVALKLNGRFYCSADVQP